MSALIVHMRNKADKLVVMEFDEFNPYTVTIRIQDHDLIHCINKQHFADVLTSLVIGEEHIEGLPKFCNCKKCREDQAEILGRKIAEARLQMEGKE